MRILSKFLHLLIKQPSQLKNNIPIAKIGQGSLTVTMESNHPRILGNKQLSRLQNFGC